MLVWYRKRSLVYRRRVGSLQTANHLMRQKYAEASIILFHFTVQVHRLPVVSAEGELVGIVSRTDVFEPMMERSMRDSDPLYHIINKPDKPDHDYQSD